MTVCASEHLLQHCLCKCCVKRQTGQWRNVCFWALHKPADRPQLSAKLLKRARSAELERGKTNRVPHGGGHLRKGRHPENDLGEKLTLQVKRLTLCFPLGRVQPAAQPDENRPDQKVGNQDDRDRDEG